MKLFTLPFASTLALIAGAPACVPSAASPPEAAPAWVAPRPGATTSMPPSSLPPNYNDPIPLPPPEVCQTCRYRAVDIKSEAGYDRVLLCARERSAPIKPLDRLGTVPRAALVACDPFCCQCAQESAPVVKARP